MNELLKYLAVGFLASTCSCLASEGNWFAPAESKVRFDVSWSGPLIATEQQEQTDDDNVMFMTSVDKEKYKCFLSPAVTEDNVKESLKDYKGQSPFELLKQVFSQSVCALKIGLYWAYELCHGYYIRQFHEETSLEGKVHQEFILGKYDIEAASALQDSAKMQEESLSLDDLPTVLVEDVQLPYIAINMTDGTFCKLNGKSRYTRVLYVCHHKGNNAIYSFREPSSCEYEVIVLTTVLCVHPAFRTNYFIESPISCYALDGAPTQPSRLVKLWEEGLDPESFKPFLGAAIPEETEEERRLKAIKRREIYPHDQKLIEDVLKGQYCLRGGSGWWRYEFCYGKHVQQTHINSDASKTVVVLGNWDVKTHLDWLNKHSSKRPQKGSVPKQISHFYANGDFCEEARKLRQVEVKLRCKDMDGRIDAVSLYLLEPRTCEYILTVESHIFCTMFEKVDRNGLNLGK